MSTNTTQLSSSYAEENRAPGLRAFCIVLIVLVVFSISMRLWSRCLTPIQPRNPHRFWLDDWFAFAAAPWILAQLSVSLVCLERGFGLHASVLDLAELLLISKNSFILYFLYEAGLFLSRESALLFLRRIFPKNNSPAWFNVGLWIGHFLNIAWLIGYFFGTFFRCNPVEKNWNSSVSGYCGSTRILYLGSAIPGVFIDLFILLLPLPRLSKIQTTLGRKIGIAIVFLLGYCVIVVSIGRLVVVLTTTDALNTDFTYAGVPVSYWATAEPVVCLFGVCVPAMLPLGHHLMNNYLSPMASKVSSMMSSRERGDGYLRSGDESFTGQGLGYGDSIRGKKSQGTVNMEYTDRLYNTHDLRYIGSQHSIPGTTAYQDPYNTYIRGGQHEALEISNDIPLNNIRVDRDIQITGVNMDRGSINRH
ncbi:hypothetical protein F4774DRAFT_429351 [Daldinia eschscholtzii]|nr:hypothetical protein F4774DRAFT_429351 [Daldinia eschscholtzii]